MNKSSQKSPVVKLIIGLGNPGSEYRNTYHSVGFLFLDYLKENLPDSSFQFPNSRLLKSDVYMNESGLFVKKALKKYVAKPEEVLIVHDDSDIVLGEFKLSFNRGSAGHKGVESVIQNLGTKEIWRLRVGIRRKILERKKAGEFVLKKIGASDREKFLQTFKMIIEALGSNSIVSGGRS